MTNIYDKHALYNASMCVQKTVYLWLWTGSGKINVKSNGGARK